MVNSLVRETRRPGRGRGAASAVRRLLVAAGVGYAAGVAALAALWSFAPERHWTIGFSSIFAAWFFAPLLALAPLALLTRSRCLGGAAAALALLFVVLFGARFVPHAAPVAGAPLRVVSLNQRFVNSDAAAVIDTIAGQDAAVVAIQELTPELAAAIASQLSATYPYQILAPDAGAGGLGLLSRLPLQDEGWVDGTRAQRAVLHVGGRAITLINVHLHFSGISRVRSQSFLSLSYYRMYDTGGREAQAQSLLDAARTAKDGVVMLGDFNTGDREAGYRLLAGELHDAFAETGWGLGFTFPNNRRMGPVTIPIPLVRIDYVWSGGAVTPVTTTVSCTAAGSDHCMLIADLAVR